MPIAAVRKVVSYLRYCGRATAARVTGKKPGRDSWRSKMRLLENQASGDDTSDIHAAPGR